MYLESRGIELCAEGNRGGDRLEIRVLSQESDTATLYLKVGSSCVYTVNHIIPVEFLTSLLTMALNYGDVEGQAPKWLEWSEEVNQRILDRIVPFAEFDDWCFDHRKEVEGLSVSEAFRLWQEELC